jgi:hypothetical protein
MPQAEENFVAVFIDWDNLAISTAVDFAGAVPDVRAIIRASQRFGTVLLARAYAEWNVSSDRLSVYRAGIEPVYAPTFRFEPEPGSQVPRGKSLADPCLVTDCIDTLHLMPNVNVFVLVSGDKDLIPIVRLAQLRGKRVVVIGPDFVAAILREMADEYIPYRVLAESSDTAPVAEVSLHGRGPRRGVAAGRNAPLPAATPSRTAPVAPAAPVRNGSPAPRPLPTEVNGNAVAEVAPATVVATPEPVVEPVPAEELLDTGPLFDTIGVIVREREQAGKPRLRATNLKDQLLARISGFNERKYGFARFKDLLAAAEKAGILVVSRTGPVQWVTAAAPALPVAPAEPTAPAVTLPPTPPTAPVPSPVAPPPVETVVPRTSAEETAAAAPEDTVDVDVVRFILELRERSRWLTYTYVLTNLLNQLGEGNADASADAAARATLNRLVQAGVLIVDREPREIDVNGTRHRVRLCHLVDEQPLVQEAARQLAAATASETATAEVPVAEAAEPSTAAESVALSPTAEASTERTPSAIREPLPEADAAASEEPLTTVITWAPSLALATESESFVAPNTGREATAAAPVVTEEWAEIAPAEPPPSPTPMGAPPEATVEFPLAPEVGELTADEPVAAPTVKPAEPAKEANGEGSVTRADHGRSNGDQNNGGPLTLTDSYRVLQEVVREATGPSRPTTGPAAVKNRLARKLGTFDERAYGFAKFKDYLLSAEKAGAVRVEIVGTSARVSLPEGS